MPSLSKRTYEDHWIGGEWVPSSAPERCPVIDPSTEEVIGEVPDGSTSDVALAVDAAVAASTDARGPWTALSPAQRADQLAALAPLIDEATPELVELLVAEVGAPVTWVRDVHVGRLSSHVANLRPLAEQFPAPHFVDHSMVVREPAGVVGSISPWNYPLGFLTKVIPALLAGCTVVAKPSEVAPLSVYRMTELVAQIELPPGVFNVVMGSGARTGAALVSHPSVDVISFTGSERTGQTVLDAVAPNLTRPVLELGGKSASIVLPGAPLETAVRKTLWNCYMNNGQVCGAQTRLLVPRAQLAEAADIAADEAATYSPGSVWDPATKLGPIVNEAQYRRVVRLICSGLTEGATLVCGGPERPDRFDRGYFVRPTVFSDVRPDMTIAQEEIFGPVLSVIGYDGVDNAVAIANHSRFGLSGAVWAESDEAAIAVARRIRTGQVQINAGVFNGRAPFGGFKHSGIGREGGVYGMLEYTEVKSLQLPADSSLLPAS